MNTTHKIEVTDEDIKDAERLENNPEMMLRLIDMLFLGCDEGNNYPS